MENSKQPIDYDSNISLEEVVRCIADKCQHEAEHGQLLIKIKSPRCRVEFYTGLPAHTIIRLLGNKEATSKHTNISKLDLDSQLLVMQILKLLITQDKPVTYQTIFEEIMKNKSVKTIDDVSIFVLSVFAREMETLGYHWKEPRNCSAKEIFEDPEVRFERYIYLNKMKKFRSHSPHWKQIVYVDERYIDRSQHFQKSWLAAKAEESTLYKDDDAMDGMIFFHAVSKHGFINGLFINRATEYDFAKWVTNILLVQLQTPSVIVMDNSHLHGSLEETCTITSENTKTDMLKWLINNHIPCSSNMSKPELYELIQKCKVNDKEYKIDRIIRSRGHEVMRLPRHLYTLSLTTPLWENMKVNGDCECDSNLIRLQTAVMDAITAVPSEHWYKYDKMVENLERQFFSIDVLIEKHSVQNELQL